MDSGSSKGTTINQGPVPHESEEEHDKEFDIVGNACELGQDPSPDNRQRGETSIADHSRTEGKS